MAGKLLLLSVYLIMSASGMLFIKMGSSGTSILLQSGALSITLNLQLLLGLCLYIVSFLLYTVVLSQFDLSYIQPVAAGIGMVLAVVFGIFFLQEKMTVHGALGIVLIIAGVVLMSWKTH